MFECVQYQSLLGHAVRAESAYHDASTELVVLERELDRVNHALHHAQVGHNLKAFDVQEGLVLSVDVILGVDQIGVVLFGVAVLAGGACGAEDVAALDEGHLVGVVEEAWSSFVVQGCPTFFAPYVNVTHRQVATCKP